MSVVFELKVDVGDVGHAEWPSNRDQIDAHPRSVLRHHEQGDDVKVTDHIYGGYHIKYQVENNRRRVVHYNLFTFLQALILLVLDYSVPEYPNRFLRL